MKRLIYAALVTLLLATGLGTQAQGTAFSYQGQLSDSGSPANAVYDFRFGVFNALTNGTQSGGWQTNSALPVTNGLFKVTLDFGTNIFNGTNYWLDISVRPAGNGTFTTLYPRQPILPVPYAIFATTASNVLGTVSASQLAGASTNQVTFTNNNNTFGGTFVGIYSGDGAGVTNLNASNLASGTVADARLTTNVALLNRDQTFSSANNFTNVGNRFTGSFFGNGNVGWDAFAGPNVQAEFNHGYLLTNSQPATITLPPTSTSSEGTNIGYIVRVSGAGSGGWRVAQNTNQSILGNFLTAISSTWQLGYTANGINGMASSSDGLKMVAVAGSGGIYSSVNGGQTWSSMAAFTMTCVASSADGNRLAAGNSFGSGSSIILSTNAGATWFSPATSVANCTALAMSSDGSRIVAVVKGGRIYTSSNYGTNWTVVSTSPVNNNKNWYAVASSSDGSRCAAAVNGGQVYTSTNYGANWTLQVSSPTNNWTSLVSSSDGSILAGTISGSRIYRSTDYGVSWAGLTNAPSANWSAMDCSSDGTRMVAAINGGGIYVSANLGETWFQQSVTNQNWQAITCSADCAKIAAGYANTTTDGGIYYGQLYFQSTSTSTTTGSSGSILGSQGSAVELQYIGNGKFMPVSSSGTIWAN